jgi:hypothetical protein
MRVNRRLSNHQKQDFGTIQRVYDLLAPERGGVEGALVDPQRHSKCAKLRSDSKDPILVIARVAYKDLCRLGHGRLSG